MKSRTGIRAFVIVALGCAAFAQAKPAGVVAAADLKSLVPSSYFGDRDRAKQKSANEIEGAASKAGETYVGADELDVFLKRQNRIELSQTPKEAMRLYLRDRLGKDAVIDELEYFTSSDGKLIYRVRFK